MSNNRNQYQSEFALDFYKEDDSGSSGFMPVAKSGLLRFMLLFGSAIIALGLVIVPVLNEKARKQTAQSLFPVGVDRMATGAVAHKNPVKTGQTHSVAPQPMPSSVCPAGRNGTGMPDC